MLVGTTRWLSLLYTVLSSIVFPTLGLTWKCSSAAIIDSLSSQSVIVIGRVSHSCQIYLLIGCTFFGAMRWPGQPITVLTQALS